MRGQYSTGVCDESRESEYAGGNSVWSDMGTILAFETSLDVSTSSVKVIPRTSKVSIDLSSIAVGCRNAIPMTWFFWQPLLSISKVAEQYLKGSARLGLPIPLAASTPCSSLWAAFGWIMTTPCRRKLTHIQICECGLSVTAAKIQILCKARHVEC